MSIDYRKLWPELPVLLRVMLLVRLGVWARRYASEGCSVNDFIRALLRERCSLRALRDVLWREVVEEDECRGRRDDPDYMSSWPLPPPPSAAPNPCAELDEILAEIVAELPPQLQSAPAILLEAVRSRELGDDIDDAMYVEWLCATGLPANALRPILLGLLDEFCADNAADTDARQLAEAVDRPEADQRRRALSAAGAGAGRLESEGTLHAR